ncbi:MAG TPA: hypothetical protein VF604_01815 [Pyrinomonadaceae bacterium]|jgi:hypothetical protein
MSLSATEPVNWDDGRLIVLSAGQTAKCENLVKDQLYALLLYNTSQIDVDAVVTVVWSNDVPPSKVTVRGSTSDGAPANFVFVSGADTDFVSISLSAGTTAGVTAFIVSVSMPLNTEGLNNAVLPGDGQFQSFAKYDRYYTQSYSGWRSVKIQNQFTQFICLQILQSAATVIVVNLGSGIADGQVSIFGPTANAAGTVVIDQNTYQSYDANIQGNGETWVWMNADNKQNSQNAQIALQLLSLNDEMPLSLSDDI